MKLLRFVFACVCLTSCSPKPRFGVDYRLKNTYNLQNSAQNVEFYDSDVLWQRKQQGRYYTQLQLIIYPQNQKNYPTPKKVDTLKMFEVWNGFPTQRVACLRTPDATTRLYANADAQVTKVYANTLPEQLNYLTQNYAQKALVSELDTPLCSKKWTLKPIPEVLYLITL